MADKKITDLPQANPGDVNGTDKIIIQDGLNTKQLSVDDFLTGSGLSTLIGNLSNFTTNDLSNFSTDDLSEGSTSLYFQPRRVAASIPQHYSRGTPWAAGSANRTTVEAGNLLVNIGGTGYVQTATVSLDVEDSSSWDTTSGTDYTVAGNRAGKDFFLYAVQPSSGNTPDFLVSADDTTPSGYTSANSRKVGGFHCLCVSVGTISGHALSDFVAGDILPQSIWDLRHRSSGTQEGTVYDPQTQLWVDIYLASWSGSRMKSVDGATIADGDSNPHFHWYNFVELFGYEGKRLPRQDEFIRFTRGANQETDISGGDPGTTTGHTDTAGRRMISDIGVEDACGGLWQWGLENSADKAWSAWNDADTTSDGGTYDGQNSIGRGQGYNYPGRPLFGGSWYDTAKCGSRSAYWSSSPLLLSTSIGARGVAEPFAMLRGA